jgi:hypothetical protein
MLRSGNVQYELAGRVAGTAYGGIGLIRQLVREQLADCRLESRDSSEPMSYSGQ